MPDAVTESVATAVVDCAFWTRRELGAGLYESVYKAVLVDRLEAAGHAVATEVPVRLRIDERVFPVAGRVDLVVDDRVLVELKACAAFAPIHAAEILTYMRILERELGLLINFHAIPFREGVRRYVRSHLPE